LQPHKQPLLLVRTAGSAALASAVRRASGAGDPWQSAVWRSSWSSWTSRAADAEHINHELCQVVGGTILALFGAVEARFAKDPLVPLGIFKLRALSVANVIALATGVGLFGMYFFLSLYLQEVNGYSPLRAGFAFLPSGLAVFLGASSAAGLVARIGARHQLAVGLAMAAGGLFWLTAASPGSAYLPHLLGPVLLVGLGFGLSFVPLTMSAMAGVPSRDAGLASGVLNTSRQVGGAVGLAALATVAAGKTHGLSGHISVASALTNGYDRAFAVAGFVLLAGASLCAALPAKARQPRHESALSETAVPAPSDA
jgi:Na+/melibiose symporter-like transporter